jgi:hypothetical protein
VYFKRKKVITKYDMKGRVESQYEDFIDDVIHDLPFGTALHYQNKFGARIEAQVREAQRPMPRQKFHVDANRGGAKRGELKVVASGKGKGKSTISKTADYTDLVNTMMEKGE